MVLSHRNHGNFSKKLTCFLKPNQKEKPKCQDFSEKIYTLQKGRTCFLFSRSLRFFLNTCGADRQQPGNAIKHEPACCKCCGRPLDGVGHRKIGVLLNFDK